MEYSVMGHQGADLLGHPGRRRDRADPASFSSDDGSLARIFRVASPAGSVAPYFRISVKDAYAITERSKAVMQQWPKISKRLRISVRAQQRMSLCVQAGGVTVMAEWQRALVRMQSSSYDNGENSKKETSLADEDC